MDDHLEVDFVVLDLSLGELLGRLTDGLDVGDLVPDTDVQHFPDGIHTNQWFLQARHGRNVSCDVHLTPSFPVLVCLTCSITSTSSQVHHPVLSPDLHQLDDGLGSERVERVLASSVCCKTIMTCC